MCANRRIWGAHMEYGIGSHWAPKWEGWLNGGSVLINARLRFDTQNISWRKESQYVVVLNCCCGGASQIFRQSCCFCRIIILCSCGGYGAISIKVLTSMCFLSTTTTSPPPPVAAHSSSDKRSSASVSANYVAEKESSEYSSSAGAAKQFF